MNNNPFIIIQAKNLSFTFSFATFYTSHECATPFTSFQTNAGIVGKYGEWFNFVTTWTYSADDLGANAVGNIFALENTEPGTTISMDEFIFELPSEKSYPVANDACNQLVVNGNAENTDGNGLSPYPFWSSRSDWWEPTITKETLANGSTNKFFRANKRKWHSDSIRTSLLKECFVKGLVYTISLRVRIDYKASPLSYYVQLKGQKADGSWTYKQPLQCPAQSASDGWVSCSGPFVIDSDYEAIAKNIEMEIIFDYGKDVDPWAVVDYDDISIAFKSGVSPCCFNSLHSTIFHCKRIYL